MNKIYALIQEPKDPNIPPRIIKMYTDEDDARFESFGLLFHLEEQKYPSNYRLKGYTLNNIVMLLNFLYINVFEGKIVKVDE